MSSPQSITLAGSVRCQIRAAAPPGVLQRGGRLAANVTLVRGWQRTTFSA
jgi:hypothetical protein